MTGQNRSTAVMQRRVEPPDSLDYFPTPPWATRALCEMLSEADDLSDQTCEEPACGEGHMVRPLREYFARVTASDIYDYGGEAQARVCDFLLAWDRAPHLEARPPDWIITNPPFKQGEAFALRALSLARVGVALLVRSAFTEGVGRYQRLFDPHPPAVVAQFTERVVLHKGRLSEKGSTATAYCWVVWDRHHAGPTRFRWIAPCRKRLEKRSDYR
ncbi:MAG: SAM-dependent DNA methyltransferase [Kiloniellales bacterium]|nr:SAM-dependent DNA methyltransferase [Kiloniellales bacterium]